ncbi:proline-rich receptor-like protein kinase PERK10 [Motacilla alba alba]|uniref:proline-rich receptor-like protein kinase PERK10 n=1 Tax=Motacilla alba alba TaxID=1094192 RepID=UPI0018D5A6FC|nr:proline-rich receptor-like protein kinase PERK10 [Motacilla alba alba]
MKLRHRTAPSEQLQQCGNNSSTLMPTPTHHSATDLLPAAVHREVKHLFYSLCANMDSKEGVWKAIPVLFHARPEKGNGDSNMERNSSPSLSLQPATLPTPTPREGQRDAPDSAQAATFVSAQGKVRGSSRRPGRQPGQAGVCAGSTTARQNSGSPRKLPTEANPPSQSPAPPARALLPLPTEAQPPSQSPAPPARALLPLPTEVKPPSQSPAPPAHRGKPTEPEPGSPCQSPARPAHRGTAAEPEPCWPPRTPSGVTHSQRSVPSAPCSAPHGSAKDRALAQPSQGFTRVPPGLCSAFDHNIAHTSGVILGNSKKYP